MCLTSRPFIFAGLRGAYQIPASVCLSKTKVFERDAPEPSKGAKSADFVSQNSFLIPISRKGIIQASCER